MDEYSALSSDRLIDLALKGDPIEHQVALCTIRGIVPRWIVRYRRPMDRQACEIMLRSIHETLPPEWARKVQYDVQMDRGKASVGNLSLV